MACSVPCAFHTHRCHPSWVPTDRVRSNIWFPSLAPLSRTQLVCRLGFHVAGTHSTVFVSWDLYLASDVPPCASPTLRCPPCWIPIDRARSNNWIGLLHLFGTLRDRGSKISSPLLHLFCPLLRRSRPFKYFVPVLAILTSNDTRSAADCL